MMSAMGGRGLVGLVIGVAFVVVVVVVVRCLPEPGNDIEWVQRADAVIVQMKTISPPGAGGRSDVMVQRIAVPEFTLYGDGTLIEKDITGSRGYSLYKDVLSTADIQALLKFIRDQGFFAFSYQEPGGPSSNVTSRTTYFYAATKEAANAVSADFPLIPTDQPTSGPPHYRKLEEIRGRIYGLVGHVSPSDIIEPNSVVLVVQHAPAFDDPAPTDGFQWPFPEFDLTSIAPDDGSIGERRVDGPLANQIFRRVMPATVVQDGRRYDVGVRPVLPYEENFPEFEPATQ